MIVFNFTHSVFHQSYILDQLLGVLAYFVFRLVLLNFSLFLFVFLVEILYYSLQIWIISINDLLELSAFINVVNPVFLPAIKLILYRNYVVIFMLFIFNAFSAKELLISVRTFRKFAKVYLNKLYMKNAHLSVFSGPGLLFRS